MCTEEKQDNIHEAKHYIPPTVNQASLMMVHYISFEQIAGKFLFSLKKKIVGTSGNSCYRSKYSIVVVNVVNDAPRVNVSFLKVWKN